MNLYRGIPGYWDPHDPALPVSDVAAFTGHCYSVARSLKGIVRQAPSDSKQSCCNYSQAILETSAGQVGVLLNAHFPVVAFAQPREHGEMQLRFIDAEPLAKLFKAFGCYEVLTSRQANMRVTAEDTLQLSRGEKEQVRYWRPRAISEIVFNFWD